jgi:hypothetical protein
VSNILPISRTKLLVHARYTTFSLHTTQSQTQHSPPVCCSPCGTQGLLSNTRPPPGLGHWVFMLKQHLHRKAPSAPAQQAGSETAVALAEHEKGPANQGPAPAVGCSEARQLRYEAACLRCSCVRHAAAWRPRTQESGSDILRTAPILIICVVS